ncbi:MAG: rhomboid family intramembrane serine protease [Bacteroidota bacterium]|nr:rhomboid family intramembrane serine protease [Bacteroidota bacterium]
MNTEKKRLLHSLLFPALLTVIMWVVKLAELLLDVHFTKFGNFPLDWRYISGILSSPFIHGDLDHLISNTVPFLVLGTALFYFYRKHAYKIFLFLLLFTGVFVWLAARPAFHIGMSGIIYALASFLIFSGFIHNNRELTSISLIVVFLYGSMVWGILPGKEEVSWESHLFGAVVGLIAALFFSKMTAQEQQKECLTGYKEYEDVSISHDKIKSVNYQYKEDEE